MRKSTNRLFVLYPSDCLHGLWTAQRFCFSFFLSFYTEVSGFLSVLSTRYIDWFTAVTVVSSPTVTGFRLKSLNFSLDWLFSLLTLFCNLMAYHSRSPSCLAVPFNIFSFLLFLHTYCWLFVIHRLFMLCFYLCCQINLIDWLIRFDYTVSVSSSRFQRLWFVLDYGAL